MWFFRVDGCDSADWIGADDLGSERLDVIDVSVKFLYCLVDISIDETHDWIGADVEGLENINLGVDAEAAIFWYFDVAAIFWYLIVDGRKVHGWIEVDVEGLGKMNLGVDEEGMFLHSSELIANGVNKAWDKIGVDVGVDEAGISLYAPEVIVDVVDKILYRIAVEVVVAGRILFIDRSRGVSLKVSSCNSSGGSISGMINSSWWKDMSVDGTR
jgi:hypothetical protein